jgi:hypothetical protein
MHYKENVLREACVTSIGRKYSAGTSPVAIRSSWGLSPFATVYQSPEPTSVIAITHLGDSGYIAPVSRLCEVSNLNGLLAPFASLGQDDL